MMKVRKKIVIPAAAAGIIIILIILLTWGEEEVIDTPDGYLRVDYPWPYLLKAVSPDGCAFTLSEYVNEGNGELATWKEAAKNQLVRGKGYVFVSEEQFKTSAGSPGWELVFATKEQGLDYVYYVAVSRWDSGIWDNHKLYVMHAAGEKEYMEKDLEGLKKAVRSLRY